MMMSAQCRLINNLADISDKAIPVKKRDRKNGHHTNTWNTIEYGKLFTFFSFPYLDGLWGETKKAF